MAFTEYLFDKEAIREMVDERKKSLAANRGLSDLLSFGLSVVAERLNKDKRRYLDYGPYWFALKELMNANGYSLGNQSDPIVKAVYHGEYAIETLVMADEFRTEYLRTNILYNNQFMLDGESGEFWILFDSDMENPATK